MAIHLKAIEQYFTVMLFVFRFSLIFVILENLTIFDLILSVVKGFNGILFGRLQAAVG